MSVYNGIFDGEYYEDPLFLEDISQKLSDYMRKKGPESIEKDPEAADSVDEALLSKSSITDMPVLVSYEIKRRTYKSEKSGTVILPENKVFD